MRYLSYISFVLNIIVLANWGLIFNIYDSRGPGIEHVSSLQPFGVPNLLVFALLMALTVTSLFELWKSPKWYDKVLLVLQTLAAGLFLFQFA